MQMVQWRLAAMVRRLATLPPSLARWSAARYTTGTPIRPQRPLDKPVIYIDADGTRQGVVPLAEAQQRARAAGLELLRVGQTPEGAVWRARARRTPSESRPPKGLQPAPKVKDLEVGTGISPHDLEIKLRRAQEWLEKGWHVRVSVVFRRGGIDRVDLAAQIQEAARSFAALPADGGVRDGRGARQRSRARATVVTLLPKRRAEPGP